MKNWFELGPFTVFDVETTGMSPACDRIVELAACRIELDGSRETFHTLLNPGRHIPEAVTRIHHITDDMVSRQPVFASIGNDFLDFIRGTTLVAHNARFDLGFLQEELFRSGLQLWNGKTLDTVRLTRSTYPGLGSYSLQSLRRHFNLDDAADSVAHRAGSDVDWTVQVLRIALERALQLSGREMP